MTTVEIRSTTGQPRNRAGLRIPSTWTPFEVDEAQLERVIADPALEVRQPPGAIAAQAALAESRAGQASSDLEATMIELAGAAQKLAGAEQEIGELRGLLDKAAADKAATDKLCAEQVAAVEKLLDEANGKVTSLTLENQRLQAALDAAQAPAPPAQAAAAAPAGPAPAPVPAAPAKGKGK